MNQLTITGVPQATRERRRVRNGKPTNTSLSPEYGEFLHVLEHV